MRWQMPPPLCIFSPSKEQATGSICQWLRHRLALSVFSFVFLLVDFGWHAHRYKCYVHNMSYPPHPPTPPELWRVGSTRVPPTISAEEPWTNAGGMHYLSLQVDLRNLTPNNARWWAASSLCSVLCWQATGVLWIGSYSIWRAKRNPFGALYC